MTPTELQRFAALPTPHDRFAWVWGQATVGDLREGQGAYLRYNELLWQMARKTNHTLKQACGVFSALSPNNDYITNLADAAAVLEGHARGKQTWEITVHTYHGNRQKAWEIADGADPETLIKGLKTYNFYRNLLDPLDKRHVTIDGHMFNIWNGSRHPLQTRNPLKRAVAVSKTRYAEIADLTRKFALTKELLPCETQATLWITWRRLHSIKTDGQLRLWDLDVERAGLGYFHLGQAA